ncbi:4-hydroxy-2-oxoheptanedioate aldolase [Deinococcus metalli]|uniref:2,4-dihydroxyhept-2-ene-1,7-dioic acid aldolase n=1 Tax=Deinococcus metalli TaxID=1141878 RepID=A0A7W8NPG0_9DEIO|nr:4-hydroxy-2-oxoheptanedioate aldolase [Deinococcus metalli]MBB5377944.1 4-hydroxy-2-oxoheptanedioate aldolase [Deinococcus metalli]GHF54948.1 2,4-dihydroxyhept-2-ene-1,7-dioic acid aldolase [Deinococcus metalli]
MTDLSNPLKRALAAGERQIGLWAALAHPHAAEVVAGAGFDWLLIDGEHAPNDVRSTLAQLQALAAYPVTPVVRPPIGDTHLIKQYLDLGVQSLLIPMVESAEQARALVAATRYPPRGVRGVGSAIARASRWNAVPDYLARADAEICLVVQIESAAGLAALDEIAAVEGVDGVFIGPADLSASLGHLGHPEHPDVVDAIADAIRRIVASGKAAGILHSDTAQAQAYLDAGCTFVAVGVDVSLLAHATRRLAAQFGRGEAAGSGGGVY